MAEASAAPILRLRDLKVEFPQGPVLHGVSFDLYPGRTLVLVGESGSGKTLSALALLGLIEAPGRVKAGSIALRGEELGTAGPERWAQIRGTRIAMVFQEPIASLNPVMPIAEQIAEPLRLHRGLNRKQARARAQALLEEVGVPEAAERLAAYPHELSGGLAQRVMIAMAIACEPEILVADEPTSSLDVTIQAQILALLTRLQRERQMALLFVTHDLALISALGDTVAVMYAGRIVEQATAQRILAHQAHPYTHALWRSSLATLPPGAPLSPVRGTALIAAPEHGCAFAARCPRRLTRCEHETPPLADGVACFAPVSKAQP